MPYGDGLAGAGVVVAVLAWVKDAGNGLQGGFGDLGANGGLAAGLVPQPGDVEGLEQPGFEPGRQVGQDVSGEREPVEQGRVGAAGAALARVLSWASSRSRSSWSCAKRVRARSAAMAVSAGLAGSSSSSRI
jgi:hypothetical protein